MKKHSRYLNEEEIKYKILAPYLQDLGFSPEEIELERSFTVVLGRKRHLVNSEKNIEEKAKGRLDILCKCDKKNLFIIEVKAEGVELSELDIEQGISYARLLHPIAPFVLLTNGKKTIVIDTITKELLSGENISSQSDFWKKDCRLDIEDELRYRCEALEKFIGFSKDNLKNFSLSQVEDRIFSLKGYKNDTSKKYIPELYLRDNELIKSFDQFLESSAKAFAIIGESGVGKTNHVCGLSEYYLSKHIVLFYNAATITRSIIDEIRDDFNWVFSAHSEAVELFRRLDYFAKEGNMKVIIFIDAIDESPNKDIVYDIDNLCRKIRYFQNIKLCISCKELEWDKFLFNRGNPSELKEMLFQVNNNNSEKPQKTLPGYIIGRFNDDELSLIEVKYREFYQFKGELEGKLREECKLPFMLRIVSEVYKNKDLPGDVDEINLLETYLNQKINRMSLENSRIAKDLLAKIGKCIIEEEGSGSKYQGRIPEHTLQLKLQKDYIPSEFFSFNILTRTEIGPGIALIGFYHTRFQDFVIATYSYRMIGLNDESELRNTIDILSKGLTGQNALRWYIPKANPWQKQIMYQYKKSQALSFLNEYEYILDKHFQVIKDRFDPETKGKIGIIITKSKTALLDAYALRPIDNEEEALLEMDFYEEKEVFKNLGVKNLRVFGRLYTDYNPSKMAKEYIFEQLKSIIKAGKLEESNNITFVLERILMLTYYYRDLLNLPNITDRFLPRYSFLLPLDLEEIKDRIRYRFAYKHYEQEQIDELIASGAITVKTNGRVQSFSYDPSMLDHDIIREKALKAAKNKNDQILIDTYYPPLKSLFFNIDILLNKGISVIDEPILPGPDVPINEIEQWKTNDIPDIMIAQYSDMQLEKYIKELFSLVFENYNILVETCFPTLKHFFPFYNLQPLNFVVECRTKNNDGWSLCYGYRKSKTSKNVVDVFINPQSTVINEDVFYKTYYSRIDKLFVSNNKARPISSDFYSGKAEEHCVIREWVYNMIEEDLEHIIIEE